MYTPTPRHLSNLVVQMSLSAFDEVVIIENHRNICLTVVIDDWLVSLEVKRHIYEWIDVITMNLLELPHHWSLYLERERLQISHVNLILSIIIVFTLIMQ